MSTNFLNFSVNSVDNLNILRSLTRTQEKVSLFCWNAQRICNRGKFDRFASLLDSFLNRPPVVGVTETWFTSQETGEDDSGRKAIRLYELDGYQSLFCSRSYRSAGVALYLRDNINYELIERDNGCVSYIHVRTKLNCGAGDEDIYLTIIYMPAVGDYLKLLEILEQIFIKIPKGFRHVIMGDLNIDIGKDNLITRLYIDLLHSYGYEISNNRTTRPVSNTIIDHVIVNFDDVVNYTVRNELSDHNVLLSALPFTAVDGTTDQESRTKRRIDLNLLRHKLQISFSDLSVYYDLDCNDALNKLMETLSANVESSTRVTVQPRFKRESKPWINSDIIRLSRKKKQLLKKLKQKPGDPELINRLHDLTRKITVKKRQLRQTYVQQKFCDGFSDSKKCWEGLNNVLGRGRKNDKPIKIIRNHDGHVLTDSTEVAEELNNFFTDTSNFQDVPTNTSNTFHQSHSSSSLFLWPTDEHEVFKLLSQLDVKKSTGPDGISNFVLKNCAFDLCKVLAVCINKTLSSGIFPNRLKIARVTPIFKGGSAVLPSNYRPISVLSAINKIYESIIAVRLKSFLMSENLLYANQYGFREASSTSTAVLEAMDFVYGNLDKREVGVVSALMVDLKKAFDSVEHSILLGKMYSLGVRGIAQDLFSSYLSNRQQFVTVDGCKSSNKPIERGVPQGSVLGPILFLIFFNDVVELALFGKSFLFADDACLLYAGSTDSDNIRRMNHDLVILNNYLRQNGLTLNVNKTKFIHMHDPRKRLLRDLQVSLHGEIVQEVHEFCYLGLWIDSNLTWKRHVDYLCSKLSCLVGILYKVRDEIPFYALKRLYFALVHSHLNYMIAVWGNASATSIKRLQKLQNRLFKLIYNLPRLTPTLSLYKDHVKDVLPVTALHFFTVCKFVKESMGNRIYHTLNFPWQQGTSANRDPYRLGRGRSLTGWGLQRITFQGPTFYNSLPQLIRNTPSVTVFLKRLKHWLLEEDRLSSILGSNGP